MTAPASTTDQHQASSIWPLVHAERAALAEDLATLADAQWVHPSLCERWVVEDVVAHLTAAASVGPVRWLASVLGARFDFDLQGVRLRSTYVVVYRYRDSLIAQQELYYDPSGQLERLPSR